MTLQLAKHITLSELVTTQSIVTSILVKSVVFILLLINTRVQAQTSEALYSVNAELGVGYGRFISDLDLNGLNKNGFNGTLRFLWQPEHLLSVGLESGYLRLYTFEESDIETGFGTTDASASLHTVPLLATFAMRITPALKIYAGTGLYFIYSYSETFGEEVSSSEISTGVMVAASYLHPLANRIHLGGELKWYRINKIDDSELLFQLVFKYSIIEY